MRRVTRWIAPLTLAVLLCGCAGAIQPGSKAEVLRATRQALRARDYDCKMVEGDAVCEHEKTYKVLISYKSERVPQLVFVSIFGLRLPCEALLAKVNDFNWRFSTAQMSCKDDKAQLMLTTILPQRGMDGEDLDRFLRWWGQAILQTLEDTGLKGVVQ